MPPELKRRIDQAAEENGRSINSEVLDRLQRSFATAQIGALSDGALLDEVIRRYAAREVTLVLAEAPVLATKQPRTKNTPPTRVKSSKSHS